MDTDTVAVKDAREVFDNDDSLSEFARLVEDRISRKDYIKQYEAEVKAIDEQLVTLLTDRDCDKAQYGKHRVAIISKELKRLDKELLMLNGVPAKVIDASMKVSHSSYLEIREIKDKVASA